ncbi:MAG: hypothetical protein K0Q73_9141, partial [Paenibacillus sp.]|nr:hypothetical protein [Paenibacillus sp.]
MNYKVRLLIATVSILLLTMIAIGCEERDVANISDNSTLPNMTGKITAINNDGRFLVVSPDKFLDQGSKKMPDASWYKMLDNAIIEYKG